MASTLSSKDLTLLSAIFQHNTNPVAVDWNNIAEQAGHKNGKVSAEMFRQLKKKLGVETSGKVSNATATSTPSPNKKRSKALSTSSRLDDAEDENEVEDEDGSPSKKAKNTPRRASKKGSRYIKQEEIEEATEIESDEAGHSVGGRDEGGETEQTSVKTEAEEVIGSFLGDEA